METAEVGQERSLPQVTRLSAAHAADLCALYQNEWWTRGRTLPDTLRMLEHTPIALGLEDPETGRLVAFARVLTDCVYKALILDVIVAPERRGQGLGKRLVEAIIAHPELAEVRHFELYCRPELVPFYRQWGFTDELDALQFLRRAK
jgi:GNAT superfamily N-acetyltransferase